MGNHEQWESGKVGQYILPTLDSYFSMARSLEGQAITDPDLTPTPEWIVDYMREMHLPPQWIIDFIDHAGENLNQIPSIKPDTSMLGENIYFHLSKNETTRAFDSRFLQQLEEVLLEGGNLVIYFGGSDDLMSSELDMGFHHALIGLEPTNDHLHQLTNSAAEFQSAREHFAYEAMPLPVFLTLLGYVTYSGASNPDLTEIANKKYERIENEITLGFTETIKLLNRISKGKLKFGERNIRDQLFHQFRKIMEPTPENLDIMYGGPMIPIGIDDEEGFAQLKEFLIKLYEGDAFLMDEKSTMWFAYNAVRNLFDSA